MMIVGIAASRAPAASRFVFVKNWPWRLFRADELAAGIFKADDEATLIDDISGLQIAYYGSLERDSAAGWLDQWTGFRGLPQLIRVRVSFPPGDPRQWADLVIAPRLYVP